MISVNVQNLIEGQVVAKDVVGRNNAIIIPAGNQIESKHLRILKIWGIHEVYIVSTEESVETSLNNINTSLQLDIPPHLKQMNSENTFTKELIAVFLKRSKPKKTGEQDHGSQ